jgi:hypothetical protein
VGGGVNHHKDARFSAVSSKFELLVSNKCCMYTVHGEPFTETAVSVKVLPQTLYLTPGSSVTKFYIHSHNICNTRSSAGSSQWYLCMCLFMLYFVTQL